MAAATAAAVAVVALIAPSVAVIVPSAVEIVRNESVIVPRKPGTDAARTGDSPPLARSAISAVANTRGNTCVRGRKWGTSLVVQCEVGRGMCANRTTRASETLRGTLP